MLAAVFIKSEKPLTPQFFIGFFLAIAGICLISFNGSAMELNPLGDMLAVLAAVVWACYSILIKKISRFDYPVLLTTRRTFSTAYCG